MILLDGRKTSMEITERLSPIVKKLNLKLSVILVGDNPSSVLYVNTKKKKCLSLGINCDIVSFGSNVSGDEVINKIELLNKDILVTGILVQLPLPHHINTRKILDAVNVDKDVDGLNSYNLTKILLNEERIIPCTPNGVISLLEEYKIRLLGKKVTIVGFSDVVGKPLAAMCINRGATVTICNTKTLNIKESTINADMVMTATGKPHLIKEEYIKQGAVVVDIGSAVVNGKLIGDVDFEKVKLKCSYITPVPGGVGPMTIISLIENLIQLKKIQNKQNN